MNNTVMAANLKALREQRQETQDEVAKAAGISVNAYSIYEAGERIPRDEIKARLADHFRTTVQAIFYTDEERRAI